MLLLELMALGAFDKVGRGEFLCGAAPADSGFGLPCLMYSHLITLLLFLFRCVRFPSGQGGQAGIDSLMLTGAGAVV